MFCRHAVFGLKLDVKKKISFVMILLKTFKNTNIGSSMQKKCFYLILKITTQT
jgi:23S rRNA C2498 (ribose-2'-O)-methylase RlmM